MFEGLANSIKEVEWFDDRLQKFTIRPVYRAIYFFTANDYIVTAGDLNGLVDEKAEDNG